MKVVYMGTPDFSVGPLEAILKAGHEVTAVVTQPDRPKGRRGELSPCPVKECALKHGLTVFQPERIKRPEAVEILKTYPADIYVVAAFGQILSAEILHLPRYGCVNIHASLLPKYRGAAPIQWAVINGEEKSGVTIMQMDEGIDTGDILLQREVVLTPEETGGSLFDRLAECGAELITEALSGIGAGTITARPQDENAATHVGMLKKEDGRIDWQKSAAAIERKIRGMDPWPSAYSRLDGKLCKFYRAEVSHDAGTPGEVLSVEKDGFTIGCGEGSLRIRELQIEGKKRMNAGDFLRGYRIEQGMRLE